jgi:tetratricopeptide (TPR) repeat protein
MNRSRKQLGKLSLAILENFVEKNLGKRFLDVLRAPTDRTLAIQAALENVEDRFQEEFDDQDLTQAIFIDLPIDKSKLGEAIGKFFDRPTDPDFPKILTQLLTGEYKTLPQSRIDNSVSFYIKVLKQELALQDEKFREKIKALADLETHEDIKEIRKKIIQSGPRPEISSKKELAELPTYKKDSDLHPVGDLPLGSYLPLPPNALFTGRENELKELANNLLDKSKSGMVITQAVTGMGGLGKTQLAVEFSYRYGKYFRGVHWINLADPSQLDSEIANCGREMDLPNFPEEQSEQVKLTLNTWKTTGPNLLILDNFEEPNQANHVFNKLRHSNICILVTSRRIDWYPTLGISKLALEVFSSEESVSFLKKFFEGSYTNREDSKNDLENLAERLGHLPLSLELASRYLRHKRLKIPEYLKKADDALEHASMKDWRADKETATKHDLNLQRTFALSWQEVKKELEQKIFMCTGYLAPNAPIPLEIFERTFSISRTEDCDESLETLYDLGLFRQTNIKSANTESKTSLPIVHSLLCEYARSLAKEDKELLEVLADTIVHLSSEALDTRLPAYSVLLRPHLPTLAIHAERGKLLKMAGALQAIYGSVLRLNADYPEAHEAYEQTLKILETTFGPNHETVAFATKGLGSLLRDMGDLSGAKEKLELALKLGEMELGANHAEIAKFAIDLGLVMRDLGDLSGAKGMFERAWEIIKANPNPTKVGDPLSIIDWGFLHNMDDLDDGIDSKIFEPNTAILFNGYGAVLHDMGNLQGAKKMYERALKIDEINFGTDHPNTAQSLHNLGRVLHDLKDLDSAKELLERATKIWENSLDLEHPIVAAGFNNLAGVLQDMGDLQGAKENYERALSIAESKLGKNHPDVAGYLNDLGTVMQAMFDFQGAFPIFERALKILESTLPPNHPRIAILTYNLAETMHFLRKFNDSRLMYERSLKIHKTLYGAKHPKVIELESKLSLDDLFAPFLKDSLYLQHSPPSPNQYLANPQEDLKVRELNDLGMKMRDAGDLHSARTAFEQALDILEKNLGEDHPQVARLTNNLGVVMNDIGDLSEARIMFERALEILEKNLGPDHHEVGMIVDHLGILMKDMGDLNGARTMFERALKSDEANFGKDHQKVATDLNNLAMVMKDLGDLNSAREMLERALKISEANFGDDHPEVANLVKKLGVLMQDTYDLNGAKIMLERALKIYEVELGNDHPEVVSLLNRLSAVYYLLGDLNSAKANLEHILTIIENKPEEDYPNIKKIKSNLSIISLMQRPGRFGRLLRTLLIPPRIQ